MRRGEEKDDDQEDRTLKVSAAAAGCEARKETFDWRKGAMLFSISKIIFLFYYSMFLVLGLPHLHIYLYCIENVRMFNEYINKEVLFEKRTEISSNFTPLTQL